MTDFDPETIAQVATRLYNKCPGRTSPQNGIGCPVPSRRAGRMVPWCQSAEALFCRPADVAAHFLEQSRRFGAFIEGDPIWPSPVGCRFSPRPGAAGHVARPGANERLFPWRGGASTRCGGHSPRLSGGIDRRVHGKPLAWLDNAATTQKPQSVINALSNFYAPRQLEY